MPRVCANSLEALWHRCPRCQRCTCHLADNLGSWGYSSVLHTISSGRDRTLIFAATTYAQVARLMALLDVNLSLQERAVEIRTRAPRARAGRSRGSSPMGEDERVIYERTTKYMDTTLPELSVAAAWVILMKLAYGLDGETRCVKIHSLFGTT